MIPVFVAEKDQNGNFVQFDFQKALPNLPHARKAQANMVVTELRYIQNQINAMKSEKRGKKKTKINP